MFCPKCGLKNVDESKFCRGCRANLSGVLAVVDGKPSDERAIAEKYIAQYSLALRGLFIGIGFLIVSGVSLRFPPAMIITLLALAFGLAFIGMGVSRLVEARALKALGKKAQSPELTPGRDDYIRPSRSIYDTDDLVPPLSVTEHTTTHLEEPSKKP